MPFVPQDLIEQYQQTTGDDHHSSYQFDHIYNCVAVPIHQGANVNAIETALWISSFLAHWGMFRGKCEIRNKNIRFFVALVDKALGGRRPALSPLIGVPFEQLRTVDAIEIDRAFAEIREWLQARDVGATDTLVSKIILGLLGNVPAYDRYFNAALRCLAEQGEYHGGRRLNGRGLHELSEWTVEFEWPDVRCRADRRLRLPRARLVDIAVHQYGRNA